MEQWKAAFSLFSRRNCYFLEYGGRVLNATRIASAKRQSEKLRGHSRRSTSPDYPRARRSAREPFCFAQKFVSTGIQRRSSLCKEILPPISGTHIVDIHRDHSRAHPLNPRASLVSSANIQASNKVTRENQNSNSI